MTSPLTSPQEEGAQAPAPAPVTARERLVVILVLAASVGVLLIAGGAVVWTRPLWFDEICCTLFVVEGAATPVEVVARVARGLDYAPPLLHLMAWGAGKLVLGDAPSPVVLRSMSLLCVSLAFVFLYATLRRRLGRLPSAAGVLAVATHSLVLAHAFEGRFYGPWLLLASAFAWSLGLDAARRSSRRDAAVAVSAVLLTTIHWFGVLSLGLMAVAAMLAYGGPRRSRLRLVAPAVAGLAAIAACVPLVLAHRAGAVEVDALWVPPLSTAQIGVIVRLFFLSTVPVVAIVLLLIGGLRDSRPQSPAGSATRTSVRDPSVAALLSLLLFPVVLVLVSIVLQPSMLDRYAIVTALSWAPLAALAVATLERAGRIAAVLFFVTLVALAGRRLIAEKREFAEMVRLTDEAYARALTLDLPIVFASLHTAYPVAGPRRAARRALFVELPDSTIRAMVPQPRLEWLRRHIAVERNIARGHARTYGFPVLAPQAQLDTTRAFFLVGPDESFPRLYKRFDLFVGKVFPHHRAERLTPYLAILRR